MEFCENIFGDSRCLEGWNNADANLLSLRLQLINFTRINRVTISQATEDDRVDRAGTCESTLRLINISQVIGGFVTETIIDINSGGGGSGSLEFQNEQKLNENSNFPGVARSTTNENFVNCRQN